MSFVERTLVVQITVLAEMNTIHLTGDGLKERRATTAE